MNGRNFPKFSMIMGVIETDWVRVGKDPEMYGSALESLQESQEEGETINKEFFRNF